MKKESELCRKPFEKELRDLDLLLQNSFLSRRDSLANSLPGEAHELEVEDQILTLGAGGQHAPMKSSAPAQDYVTSIPRIENSNTVSTELSLPGASLPDLNLQDELKPTGRTDNLDICVKLPLTEHAHQVHQPTPEDSSVTPLTNGVTRHALDSMVTEEHHEADRFGEARPHVEPLTPALSAQGDIHPFANGGVPWYMVPFDPVGTTVEEERWTGRDLVRGMSEELSDMDEEQLSGLVEMEIPGASGEAVEGKVPPRSTTGKSKRRKGVAKRKRWRGYR
jgi:NuA3 HAT complex component NTO1